MDHNKFDVFLSHNGEDKPTIEVIARRLRAVGLSPWLDQWNLIPGEPWQPALEEALQQSATCAIFIGKSGIGPWQHEEMRAAIDRRVSQSDFRVIPVLLPNAERGERSQLPRFLLANVWVDFRASLQDEEALRRLECGIRGIPPGPRPDEVLYGGECPYRGLHFFDVSDSRFFFGREALTQWLLEAFRQSRSSQGKNRFLAIVGASGSGKSSIARAGLLAALRRGELEHSQHWSQIVLRPGTNPLENLAIAAADAFGITDTRAIVEWMRELQSNHRSLHLRARLLLRDAPESRRFTILVDQFEELFTLCQDQLLRQAFIDNLLYAAGVVGGQTVVVLTMRADFLAKCASYPTLAAVLSAHQELIGPMSNSELREAIERPAQLVGCMFETGLIDVLVRGVSGEPGRLPLLQHALLELWGAREDRSLTLRAYAAMGGLEGALAKRAEAIYDSLGHPEQMIARRILLRLTQPGEGTEDTRRRAYVSELVTRPDEHDMVMEVIEILARPGARLIVVDSLPQSTASVVDISHEALIRGWPRLRQWIDDAREDLRIQNHLSEAARDWERRRRDQDLLFRGSRLLEALEWRQRNMDNTPQLEAEFLRESEELRQAEAAEREARRHRELDDARKLAEAESHRAEEAARRARLQRQLARVAVAASVLLAIFSLFSVLQWWRAERERNRAERERNLAETQRKLAVSRQLTVLARSDLERLDRRLLLAAEAQMAEVNATSRGVMLQALQKSARIYAFLHGNKSNVRGVHFSPDGKILASVWADGTVMLWDVAARKPIGAPLTASDLGVDPDPFALGFPASFAFDSDTKRLALAELPYGGGTIVRWDMSTFKRLDQTQIEGKIMTSSPDGRVVGTVRQDGVATLWDTMSGARLQTLAVNKDSIEGDEKPGALSPDGRTLALSSQGGKRVILWDTSAGRARGEPLRFNSPVTRLAFNPAGNILASAENTAIQLWDVSTRRPLHEPLNLHKNAVECITFSPDGRTLASAGDDGTVRLWDVNTSKPLGEPLIANVPDVLRIDFSPDGRLLAAGNSDGTIVLWDVTTDQPLASALLSEEGKVKLLGESRPRALWSLALSPDGRTLALGTANGVVSLWDIVTRRLLKSPLIGHSAGILELAFSSDGKKLASASADQTVILWDVDTAQRLGNPLRGHSDEVTGIAIDPNSQILASASADDTVKLWNLTTRQQSTYLSGRPPRPDLQKNYLLKVAFSPDGRILALAGTMEAQIFLWDVRSGQLLGGAPLNGPNVMLSLAFSPDGRTLATGLVDETVILWDVATRRPRVGPLSGHIDDVEQVAFSPDGQTLASGSKDNTVILWDVASGQALGDPLTGHTSDISGLAFTPDGKTLVSGSTDGSVLMWGIDTASLQDRACRMANRNLTCAEWCLYFPGQQYRPTCRDLPGEKEGCVCGKGRGEENAR